MINDVKKVTGESRRGAADSIAAVLFCAGLLSACAPEIGSEAWCNEMKEKPKGEWTANGTKDFAKHCIL